MRDRTPDDYEQTTGHEITCAAGFTSICDCQGVPVTRRPTAPAGAGETTPVPAHVAAALHMLGGEAHPTETYWRVELQDGDQWLPCGSLTRHRQVALDALAARRSVAKTWAADGQPVRYRVIRETTTYTVEDAS